MFLYCNFSFRFENDRTISFIPPDGEFELMSYRLNTHVSFSCEKKGSMFAVELPQCIFLTYGSLFPLSSSIPALQFSFQHHYIVLQWFSSTLQCICSLFKVLAVCSTMLLCWVWEWMATACLRRWSLWSGSSPWSSGTYTAESSTWSKPSPSSSVVLRLTTWRLWYPSLQMQTRPSSRPPSGVWSTLRNRVPSRGQWNHSLAAKSTWCERTLACLVWSAKTARANHRSKSSLKYPISRRREFKWDTWRL